MSVILESAWLLRRNIRDIRTLGWAFLLRYIGLITGRNEMTLKLRKIGKIRFRLTDSDVEIIRQIFSNQDYNLANIPHHGAIQQFCSNLVAAGQTPIIIDAGANIGASSLWFANQFPQASIIAVEPEPANANLCRANLASYPNAMVIEGAIGGEGGWVVLENTEGDAMAVRTARSGTGRGIPIFTISDLMNLIPRGQLLMVKIDIEGFESDLFSTDTEWVALPKVIIIEPHDWLFPGRKTSQTFQRTLANLDCELFIKGENLIYVNLAQSGRSQVTDSKFLHKVHAA
jgi:FkbM family methyltransferase